MNRRQFGWLPGLTSTDADGVHTLTFPGLELRTARLSAPGLEAQMERVALARDRYLRDLPVQRIVRLLDRVASRWLDPASPYRLEAECLLPSVTGYAEPAIRKGLTSYLAMLREENLLRLLDAELPQPAALDGFVSRGRGGGQTRAFGPRLTTHVWSGNVPGLSIQSLICTFLVKSAALGKVASNEPVFATLFAESVAEVDERLAECLAVTYWPGGDETLESVAFNRADAVIAYGSERAIDAVRAHVSPTTTFVPYGHKLSFGVIAREALASDCAAEVADRAAYDVAKYDQQGCLSPHLFYVEDRGDTSPREFAELLGTSLERYAGVVPRGRISLEEGASIASLRSQQEMRQVAGEDVMLLSGDGWTVVADADPTFEASCLNRTIRVKPVSDMLHDVPRLATPVRRYLQTCGVAADPERRRQLAEHLGQLGLDRVCPLGRMGDVAPTWHHDGRFNLLSLLRWTDLEPEVSAGQWQFAHPHLGVYGKEVAE
ncbi:MAG: acyl-CoA reductase [Chloroflexi bacterium]|nr:acyl-CoA reductase [Chloroflexota bacterium]